MKIASLVYFLRSSKDSGEKEVLLAMTKKEPHKPAGGKWNGYGGKMDEADNGDIIACAIRETENESGVSLEREDLKPAGKIDFYFFDTPKDAEPNFRVEIFTVEKEGVAPTPSDEMSDPTWFKVNDIAEDMMMPADYLFLPDILAGQIVSGWVKFKKDFSGIEENHLVSEVQAI